QRTGKPHAGKMLAAIQPHCDDVAIFAGGTVLKLIDEGYRGILINLSDDSMAGVGRSIGDNTLKNEDDTIEVAKRLGLEEVFFLNYPNHNMDGWSILEMRARLIFIFRLMKVDTVVCYDPSALYERNPDHTAAAKAIESACWMSRSKWDYPEHFKVGLTPHGPLDKYYFARGPQLVNRVVDTTDYIDGKVDCNLANVTQGPSGNNGARLRRELTERGRRLPILGDDDDTANREYTKHIALRRDRLRGMQYGLEYAEVFHYSPADDDYEAEYVREHSVSR
ncbi:MAG: PIG-L family deacetylase, partial [Proteobacteria bacterium]|nr:PIG-L family deacetylase [Pseudomonadota bacterium]